MIFPRLPLFHNILFIIALISIFLLVTYLVVNYIDSKQKKREITDDIDSMKEEYESFWGFLFNAFKIKGFLFFLSFGTSIAFLVSTFWNVVWAAVLIGVIAGFVLALLIAFLERKPLTSSGEIGCVSVDIPASKSGRGKVILENALEVDAETEGGELKKGEKVIVKKNQADIAVVEKDDQQSEKKTRKILGKRSEK